MNVQQLINKLEKLPKDLPIRTINPTSEDNEPNKWVYDIEASIDGQSGYEVFGEVRLLTSE